VTKTFRVLCATSLIALSVVGVSGREQGPSSSAAATAPTFSHDVAPILYRNCVSCHRPGEMAPMSLLTYDDARPWARAIDKQVSDGAMPPWFADAPPGTFENERRLTAAERDVIARWVAAGAPQGNPADLPAPPSFADGWRIGTPDVVLEMQEEYAVPARGTIEYEYFYIPTNFTESKWLQAIEVRPGNRSLVHHVLVYYQAPPDDSRAVPVLDLDREHNRLPRRTAGTRPQQRDLPSQLIGTYAPGTDPQAFSSGMALRLPPGSVIELQVHYSTTGTAGTDRTKVGMVFAKEPPAREIRASQFLNARFTIPAGAADYQVDTAVGFREDATIWGLFPHTHVRGKRWSYVLALPDGTTRPLLSVPKYDFNWQAYYLFKEPVHVPKGARILSSAWYDNSASNRSNPDPRTDVSWGDQTWQEMQYTGILYSVREAAANP
jgi:hypothetical protein